MTTDREARRERIRQEIREKTREVAKTATPGTLEEIRAAARKTNLAYLWSLTPKEYTLTESITVEVSGNHLFCSLEFPKGTPGWLYAEISRTYDKYVRVGDEEYPAPDAKEVSRTTYYTWCCLVQVEGQSVLASAFRTVCNG